MNNENIELLALARKQIYDEYIEKSSKDLSEWLLKSDVVWKQSGALLPYPKLSVYPEEEEILARYKALSAPVEPPPPAVEEVKPKLVEVEKVEAEPVEYTPPKPTFLQSLSIFGEKE